MRIHADLTRCEGHGMCAVVAPRVFALDDDATVVVLHEDVPDALVDEAGAGIDACPVAALHGDD